jgi:ABC-2 type transport system permease protein
VKSAIIVVIVGLFLALRVWRRRRARSLRGSPGPTSDHRSSDIALVIRREVRERIKTRAFRISTLIVLLAIGAAIIIPVALKGKETTVRVGVVGTTVASVRPTAEAAAAADSAKATVTTEPSLAAAVAQLRDKHLDLVVYGRRNLVVQTAISPTDNTPLAYVTESLARTLGTEQELIAAGVSATRAVQLARPVALPVIGLKPAKTHSTRTVTSIYVLILTYILLTQYGMWVMLGVVEEKSNRIVEVLLSTLSAMRLLAGKVMGVGLVALGQVILLVAVAIGLAESVGSTLVKGTAASQLGVGVVFLILGYAFYCWVYAAVGSLIDRQDQVQSVSLPVQLPILFGYIISFFAVGSTNPSLFMKVLGFLPITSPFTMPVLYSVNAVSWWELLISVLILIGSTVGLARIAATVYTRAILHTGRRMHLQELVHLPGRPRLAGETGG